MENANSVECLDVHTSLTSQSCKSWRIRIIIVPKTGQQQERWKASQVSSQWIDDALIKEISPGFPFGNCC